MSGEEAVLIRVFKTPPASDRIQTKGGSSRTQMSGSDRSFDDKDLGASYEREDSITS